MTDGPAAAPISAAATEGGLSPAGYARIYEAEQPRLVAYARSLTANPWLADDLVAEAHFRVWRRLAAGHAIDNVAAYLTTTVRHLAATAGRGAARETPLDPHDGVESAPAAFGAHEDQDPAVRAAGVDLLARVLGQLPERWVKALWLAEAEGQPLEAVGRRIGAGSGATAVLLHRAREGMRQAFLRAHPGTPEDPACEAHWDRMPAHVRDEASARQSEKLLAHIDTCDDCRARLAVLLRANDRLPALAGPALLVFALGGAGTFLLPLATGAGAGVASGGHGSGLLHGMRHVLTGGSKAPGAVAGVLGVSVAGAAVAAGLVFSGPGDPVPPQRAATVADSPAADREGTQAPAPRQAQPAPSTPPSPGSAAPDPVTPDSRQDPPAAPSAPKPPDRPSAPAEPGQPTASTAPRPPAQRQGPATPTAPVQPTAPEAPAAPPQTPDTPAAPATPTAPAAPPPSATSPTTPPAPTGPETTTPTEPTGPAQPTQPTQPTEPAEPTQPPQPTEPARPTGPTPPTQPTEPTQPAEPSAPAEPTEPAPACEPWLGPIYVCHFG
ncbi:sigma factor [Streptomyces sp. cg35]|uniref:sigma factor n=1 Tax=Streptomyces sp. cg35 TaxID=3421650 RepID=UPI003D171914